MVLRRITVFLAAAALVLLVPACGDDAPSEPSASAGITGWSVSVFDEDAGGSWSYASVRLDHEAQNATVEIDGHGCPFQAGEPGFGSYAFWNEAVPGGFEPGSSVPLSVVENGLQSSGTGTVPGLFHFTKIVQDAGKLRLDWAPSEDAHYYVVYFLWPGQVAPEQHGFLTDAPYLYLDYPDDWPADQLDIWVYAVNGPKPRVSSMEAPVGYGWPFAMGWLFTPTGPKPRAAEPGNVSGASGGYWLVSQVIGIRFELSNAAGGARRAWRPLGAPAFREVLAGGR